MATGRELGPRGMVSPHCHTHRRTRPFTGPPLWPVKAAGHHQDQGSRPRHPTRSDPKTRRQVPAARGHRAQGRPPWRAGHRVPGVPPEPLPPRAVTVGSSQLQIPPLPRGHVDGPRPRTPSPPCVLCSGNADVPETTSFPSGPRGHLQGHHDVPSHREAPVSKPGLCWNPVLSPGPCEGLGASAGGIGLGPLPLAWSALKSLFLPPSLPPASCWNHLAPARRAC